MCNLPLFDEQILEQMLLEQKWLTFPAHLCLSQLDTASVGHSPLLSPFCALRCAGGRSVLRNRLTSLGRLLVSRLTEACKANVGGWEPFVTWVRVAALARSAQDTVLWEVLQPFSDLLTAGNNHSTKIALPTRSCLIQQSEAEASLSVLGTMLGARM